MYLGIWQCLQGNMILRMPHMNNDWLDLIITQYKHFQKRV